MHCFQYNFDLKTKSCNLPCKTFRKVKTNFKNCFQVSCKSCLKSWKLPQFLKNLTILLFSCPNHLTKHNTETLFPRLYTKKKSYWNEISFIKYGQVDSPELPETPEITEMMENFTKVTKYLTKFKETINYVWEKPHVKKQ